MTRRRITLPTKSRTFPILVPVCFGEKLSNSLTIRKTCLVPFLGGINNSIESVNIDKIDDIIGLSKDAEVIGIDEIQFFNENIVQ